MWRNNAHSRAATLAVDDDEVEEEEIEEIQEIEEVEEESDHEDEEAVIPQRRASEKPAQRPPLHPMSKSVVPRLGLSTMPKATVTDEDEDEEDEEAEVEGSEASSGVAFDDDNGKFSQQVVDFLADESLPMLEEGYAPFAEVAALMELMDDEDAFTEAMAESTDRQEQAKQLIYHYVDEHYRQFNKSITYFSQMIADVYDVEETLQILSSESLVASGCLQPQVEELRVFHDKALRAAMKARILSSLNLCIQNEHQVASLVQTKRHITAVKALQQFTSTLQGPTLKDLTCTQRLQRTADTLQSTLQRNICSNLQACVFRRFRLQDSLDEVVDEIIAASSSGRNAGAIGVVAKGLQQIVSVDVINIQDDESSPRPELQHLTFIPVCIKSLYLLDPRFLARAELIYGDSYSQKEMVKDFVVRYLSFYVLWQRRCNRQSDTNALSVQATRRVADRFCNVVTTVEEAVVKMQAQSLRAFFGILCKELGKILRNADFAVCAITSMEFPFLQRELMAGVSVDKSPIWEASVATTLQGAHDGIGEVVPPLRSLLLHIVGKARVACATITTDIEDRTAMTALWQKVDVNTFLVKWGVDPSPSAPEPFVGSVSMMPSFGDFLHHLKDICDHMITDAAPRISRQAADRACLTVAQQMTLALKETSVRRVTAIRAAWDVGALWEHIEDALISIINILCAVRDEVLPGGSMGDDVAGAKELPPSWVPSTRTDYKAGLAELMRHRSSSAGGPHFVGEIGHVSFSLAATASVIWNSNRQANTGGAVTASAKDPFKSASAGLEHHLLLSKRNAIVVFGIVDEFVKVAQRRVPLVLANNKSRALAHINSLVANSFAPSLLTIHAKQLRERYIPYLPSISPPVTSLDSSPPIVEVGCQTAYDPSSPHPLLSAVTYVHAVAIKTKSLTRGLPRDLADELMMRVIHPLTETLLASGRDCVTSLGLGSFAYRFIHQPFLDVYDRPLEREASVWHVLKDESNIYGCQVATDEQLFAYYEANNKERTSGHHASMNTVAAADQRQQDLAVQGDLFTMEGIGRLPSQYLRLRSHTAIVGLALVCHSFEWLGNALLGLFYDGAAAGTVLADVTFADASPLAGMTGHGGGAWAAKGLALSNCCVPGTVFTTSFQNAMGSRGKEAVTSTMGRLLLLYRQTVTVAQAALFVLAIDARFTAFRYLPQIRDEPFTWLATPNAPDAVITQYNRSTLEFAGLIASNLGSLKRKYIALTMGSPVGKLVLSEMSLLRDKRITDSGQQRLQNNLLALRSTLQMLLPGDVELAQSVQDDLHKVNIFFNNLRNRDVVNTIVSSGEYLRFQQVEVMNLITLVFRSESSEQLAEQVASYVRRTKAIKAKQEAVVPIIQGTAQQMIMEAQAAAAARAAPPQPQTPAQSPNPKQSKPASSTASELETESDGEEEEQEEDSSDESSDASSEPEAKTPRPVTSPIVPTLPKPATTIAIQHVSEDEDTEEEEEEEIEEVEEIEEEEEDVEWEPK